jgi:serine/threonine-protein phosphatase 5
LQAAKVAPKDPDLRKKLAECEKAIKRIKFEEALATPVSIWCIHYKCDAK